ncbi:MAG: PRD domain-containing protein [Streptococcaceae bacterium]|jgi:PRD domain protein (TIGR03582 family)|nr:PRD domain-containing protein [Streptococcaceae bacterium]
MNLSKKAEQIIMSSSEGERLKQVILFTQNKTAEMGVELTELQWTVLVNHLDEMLKRSLNNQEITGIDSQLFTEISKEALEIAEAIVLEIGNLSQSEMYVLSIHFENGKQ